MIASLLAACGDVGQAACSTPTPTATATAAATGGSGSGDGGFIGSLATSAWEGICNLFGGAAVDLLKAFADAFATFPSINPQDDGIRSVYSISLGIAAIVMVLLILLQITKTVLTHDGAGLAHGIVGLGKAVLAFVLTLAISAAAIEASNDLTKFIIDASFKDTDGLKQRITAAFVMAALEGESATLVMVLAVVAIVCTLVLWFELLLANAAIAVLIGTSPIAAAGQTSAITAGWWPKLVSATTQLIILKPVIALVFSVGFSLMGKSQDLAGLMSGVLVLVLAVFAWPAIAKFFTFASVSLGGGAGVGAVLGFAAGRMNAPKESAGTGQDEGAGEDFAAGAAARTMATHAARTGGSTAAAKIGEALAAAALGPGGPAAGLATKMLASNIGGALDVAQRSVNSLSGRMGQMAGHAGLDGANPHPHSAGYPRHAPVPWQRPKSASGSGSSEPAATGQSDPGPSVDVNTPAPDSAPDIDPPSTGADGQGEASPGADTATPAQPGDTDAAGPQGDAALVPAGQAPADTQSADAQDGDAQAAGTGTPPAAGEMPAAAPAGSEPGRQQPASTPNGGPTPTAPDQPAPAAQPTPPVGGTDSSTASGPQARPAGVRTGRPGPHESARERRDGGRDGRKKP